MDKNQDIQKFEENRKTVRTWAWIVYGAGVAFAVAFSEALILDVFEGQSVIKAIAGLAVLVIASNALLFPHALHKWAVTGAHKGWTIAFYALDILFLLVNTVVSFSNLAGKMPGWAEVYMPYAPAAMVIQGIASWAVIFMLDPGEKSKVKLVEAWQSAQVDIIQLAVNWLRTPDGEQVLRDAAGVMAGDIFNVSRLSGKPSAVANVANENALEDMVGKLVSRALEHVTPSHTNVTPTPQREEAGQTAVPFGRNGQKH